MGRGSLRKQLFIGFVVIVVGLRAGYADWIALTGAEKASSIAEIYIETGKVRVILEVGEGDFQQFRSLNSKDSEVLSGEVLAGVLRIEADGRILVPQIEKVELRKRQSRYVKQHNVGGETEPNSGELNLNPPGVHYAELLYRLESKPSVLTFVPAADVKGRAIIEIGLILFHHQLPVIDYQFLKQPETLILDWKDPWYSRFENPQMKRHQQSGVMAYLYIEPNEVRQEILVRIADLSAWTDLGLAGNEVIAPNQQEALKNKIAHFLLNRNLLTVDGQVLRPILDRVDYLSIESSGIKQVEEIKSLGVKNTLVGVIIAYVTDKLPRKVTIKWDLFSDAVSSVPVTAYDLAGQYDSYVTREAPLFEWENFFDDYDFLEGYQGSAVSAVEVSEDQSHIEIPILSVSAFLLTFAAFRWLIICRQKGREMYAPVGVMFLLATIAITTLPYMRYSIATRNPQNQLDSETAALILGQLLKNIYRAFDFREEDDVYDKLSVSVGGKLLDKIYLQNRQSIAAQQMGGARAKVKRVEVINADAQSTLENSEDYLVNAKWTTFGTVAHWGHVHTRKNLYQASITLTPEKGRWKITGFEMLEEKRIDPENENG